MITHSPLNREGNLADFHRIKTAVMQSKGEFFDEVPFVL